MQSPDMKENAPSALALVFIETTGSEQVRHCKKLHGTNAKLLAHFSCSNRCSSLPPDISNNVDTQPR